MRDAEPVAYRIAVAPFEVEARVAGAAGELRLQRSAAELQQNLVDALREVQAASEVFPIDSPLSYEAFTANADLMLRPRLQEASFAHIGNSERAFVSFLLWFTTWIGSLWVEDSSYSARLVVRYDIIDPHTGLEIANDLEARSERVDLAFWERNSPFSGAFFAAMVVPPFLAGDDAEKTVTALLHRANALVAAQLKSYLVENLPVREREVLAQVQIRSPRNGSDLRAGTPLRGEIVARRIVTQVQVLLNGELYHKWEESELPSEREQARGAFFVCPIRLESLEGTQPGRNVLRVLVNVAGQWASRSLVLYRDEDGSSEGVRS